MLSRTWHNYWSLGRPQKQQQDKNIKKLRKIVSKLWSIMDGNGYLLTAALFCMAVAALAELAIPHFTTRTIFSVANLGSKAKFYDNVQILAVLSVSYGLFAGLRGFLISLLNTQLIQNLRSELFRTLIRQ
ncbi:g8932 [Coccomyxa viridis]|uniref:G8932 protein n=1 Tax=Coccomyxa viridis TaxID=1274662 RepID=A0ABP1G1M3_9CHLO